MKYGSQLFGPREIFRKDPDGFCREMTRMGCEYLEPCILARPREEYPEGFRSLWTLDETAAEVERAARHGVKVRSCMLFTSDILSGVDVMLRLRAECGIEAFVTGTGTDGGEGFDARCAELKTAACALRAGGAELWLHNGSGSDCEKIMPDGYCLYESILRRCPTLGAEVDNGWVLVGGQSDIEMMERLGDKLRAVHIKDLARDWRDREGAARFAVLSEGVTKVSDIMKYAERGLPIIIDQDFPIHGYMEDLRISIAAMKAEEK